MSTAALRILAVDNEPSVTFSLRHIFNGPRYDLTAVENGDAALSRIDSCSEQYDIIIVDQKMPHMSGLELVGEMRNAASPVKSWSYRPTFRPKCARPTNAWMCTSCSRNRSTSATFDPRSIISSPKHQHKRPRRTRSHLTMASTLPRHGCRARQAAESKLAGVSD